MVTDVEYSEIEAMAMRTAAKVFEDIIRADLLMLVCQDSRGVFIMPLPGCPNELFSEFGAVNWKTMFLEAQEHRVES